MLHLELSYLNFELYGLTPNNLAPICTSGNTIPGRNLPVLNFAYHLSKPWTDQFTYVNGKQPPLYTFYGAPNSGLPLVSTVIYRTVQGSRHLFALRLMRKKKNQYHLVFQGAKKWWNLQILVIAVEFLFSLKKIRQNVRFDFRQVLRNYCLLWGHLR